MKNELYRHVETFNLANPKLFKDAVITENLSICKVKKGSIDKYNWMDLVLRSVDQRYIEFYKWNIKHNKGLAMNCATYKQPDDFDINLDFIETNRCVSKDSGAGFGKGGCGYKYNVLQDGYKDSWMASTSVIHFNNKKAKNNFATCWYNSKKGESLISIIFLGLHIVTIAATYYFAIPQIDWASISDKYPDYEKDPDFYVLKEMGLKWDDKKEKIIKE